MISLTRSASLPNNIIARHIGPINRRQLLPLFSTRPFTRIATCLYPLPSPANVNSVKEIAAQCSQPENLRNSALQLCFFNWPYRTHGRRVCNTQYTYTTVRNENYKYNIT